MSQISKTNCSLNAMTIVISIMRMENEWYIVQLNTDTKKSDKTDLLELKENILKYITASIANKIEDGRFGAVATSNKFCDDGYWIVEWKDLPYFEDETNKLVCDVN